MPEQTLPWKRLLTEGAVIVVSILLAFAIDAWWEERQEYRAAMDQVARVISELQANAAIIQVDIRDSGFGAAAAAEFLEMFGPDPETIDADTIGEMVNRLYSVGTLSLARSATQDFLSSGQLTDARWTDVRDGLAKVVSAGQVVERASLELRDMRVPIQEYIQKVAPYRNIVLNHPIMADYTPGRFPFNSHALLSDVVFEGYISAYAIRLELNRMHLANLLEQHQQLIDEVNAVLKP